MCWITLPEKQEQALSEQQDQHQNLAGDLFLSHELDPTIGSSSVTLEWILNLCPEAKACNLPYI